MCLAAWGIRQPAAGEIKSDIVRALQSSRDYRPLEVLKAPVFWVMYLMFFLVAAAGLMAIMQLAPIAKEYKVANEPASILALTLPALTFALAIDRVFSGLTRPFFGWVSDRIGREHAMGIAFAIEAAAIVALPQLGHDPLLFVLLTVKIKLDRAIALNGFEHTIFLKVELAITALTSLFIKSNRSQMEKLWMSLSMR